MSRKVKSIAGAVGAGFAFILLVIAAGVVFRPPAPLTAVEKRLVGNWNKVRLPEDEYSSDMVFLADRTFHANDGQFVGNWWIKAGQLHIKYHSDDWREHWSNWQPIRLWRMLRSDSVKLDIRFAGDDRVEMAEPGGPPWCALLRLQ